MNYSIIYQDVEVKWRNYAKYIKLITEEVKNQFNENEELNKHISFILVNPDEMHQLNFQFRKIDRPTDVLTFVDDEDPEHLGDIFINVAAVLTQAQEYQHSIKREFCFLVTHGMLHLLGYDHHTLHEEKEMFGLQEEILNHVGATR